MSGADHTGDDAGQKIIVPLSIMLRTTMRIGAKNYK
jgi:hypothetical protein